MTNIDVLQAKIDVLDLIMSDIKFTQGLYKSQLALELSKMEKEYKSS